MLFSQFPWLFILLFKLVLNQTFKKIFIFQLFPVGIVMTAVLLAGSCSLSNSGVCSLLFSVKQLEAAVNNWWLLWLLGTQQEHLRDIISVVRDSQQSCLKESFFEQMISSHFHFRKCQATALMSGNHSSDCNSYESPDWGNRSPEVVRGSVFCIWVKDK